MHVWIPLALSLLATARTPSAEGGTDVDDSVARISVEPVELRRSNGESVWVDRVTLHVPIVRANPDSKELAIDVWLFPALDEAAPNTPPIFQLNGGPGWPGLEPGSIDFDRDVLPMVQLADLVIVGQRGIGTSTNTPCEGYELDRDDPSAAEQAEALRRACMTCREHWEAQGYDLSGFNVIEAAADVDDVRRLLGYEQITVWGGSFGSHWGMALLRYFPDSVARAVLHGMEGPDHTYDHPGGYVAALERIAFEAETSNELLDDIPDEGLIEAFRGVVARAEELPIEVEVQHPDTGEPVTVRFDADDVRGLAFGYTQRANSRGGAAFWPADVIALHRGDFSGAARQKLRIGDGGAHELPTASFFMLDCGSGISPARLAELHADPATYLVGNPNDFYETACPVWGADLGDEFRAGFTTDVPTVVVHGTWDLSTPYENALELLPTFENLHFVTVEGGSHGALSEARRTSRAFERALNEFFTTGDMSNLPEEVRMPDVIWKKP